ncbi:hypothetical protein [Blastococcus sp. SYSU DS0533]
MPGQGARRRPAAHGERGPWGGLYGEDLSAVGQRTGELSGAQVDVTQAVVLVTTSGLTVRPGAPD